MPDLHLDTKFPILLVGFRASILKLDIDRDDATTINTGADFMVTSINGSDSSSVMTETESSDILERNRLINKGKGVLDLCIEKNKLLCVQGFVDSQIERGGVYLEVVREMREYIASELTRNPDRNTQRSLRDLHAYISEKMPVKIENAEPVLEE